MKELFQMNESLIHSIANDSGAGKLLYISAVRFIAMLLIIMCHICQYYNSEWAWWLNVGVQIFLILSGFLYGNKSISAPIKWIKRNAHKILLPYYVFLSLSILIYYVFFPHFISLRSVVESIFCIGTIKGIENLWFVGYILFCYLLTPYLELITETLKGNTQIKNIYRILLFFALFYVISDLLHFYFQPDKIICYFVGYFTAFFVRNYGKQWCKWIFFMSAPFALFSKMIYFSLKSCVPPSLIGYLGIFSHTLLGIALTFGLILLFQKIKFKSEGSLSQVLKFSDKYSYCIYLSHQLFILSPFTLMLLTKYKTINICTTLIVIIIAGVVLQKVSAKVSNCFIQDK